MFPLTTTATSAPTATQLAAAHHVFTAAATADGTNAVSDQTMLAVTQGERTLVLYTSGSIAGEPTVAAAVLGNGELDLVVHPRARERGVGAHALRELLEMTHDELRVWVHGEQPAATTLLHRAGCTPTRTLYRMELPPEQVTSVLATAAHDAANRVQDLQGFQIRPYLPQHPSDASAWVRVNAAAFASHPEQGRITERDFALMREEPWFAAYDLLLLAPQRQASHEATNGAAADTPTRHDETEHEETAHEEAAHEEIAGYAWVKTLREGGTGGDTPRVGGGEHETREDETREDENAAAENTRTSCELYAIGVHPEYAGRGFGGALLNAALAVMARHTPSSVSLYVDGDNTHAIALYKRVGFALAATSTQWLRAAA